MDFAKRNEIKITKKKNRISESFTVTYVANAQK